MKKQLSLEIIKRWLKDTDCDVRRAAMNACQGKDVPLEIIKRGLKDTDCDVRSAAMNACIKNGIQIPIIRTVEPPETVYKKCCENVIVCATIPKDAQIRGSFNTKCRANKAIITEIIGDFCGEKVGISSWDKTTTYFVGDKIEIQDFDYSDEECATGFHFFCKKELAEQY